MIVSWRPRASADLVAIMEYIAAENPDAAQALKDSIESKAARLAENPRLFRSGRVKGTREMTAHPNYIVVYRVNALEVEVLRVKHAAQKWP